MATHEFSRRYPGLAALLTFVALSWNAFIAAFIYYTMLTVLSVGGVDASNGVVLAAYLVPVVAYAAVLAARIVHALSVLPIDIGKTPQALLH